MHVRECMHEHAQALVHQIEGMPAWTCALQSILVPRRLLWESLRGKEGHMQQSCCNSSQAAGAKERGCSGMTGAYGHAFEVAKCLVLIFKLNQPASLIWDTLKVIRDMQPCMMRSCKTIACDGYCHYKANASADRDGLSHWTPGAGQSASRSPRLAGRCWKERPQNPEWGCLEFH